MEYNRARSPSVPTLDSDSVRVDELLFFLRGMNPNMPRSVGEEGAAKRRSPMLRATEEARTLAPAAILAVVMGRAVDPAASPSASIIGAFATANLIPIAPRTAGMARALTPAPARHNPVPMILIRIG